jgi:hypothetical protein
MSPNRNTSTFAIGSLAEMVNSPRMHNKKLDRTCRRAHTQLPPGSQTSPE